jgi:hypothetical protein
MATIARLGNQGNANNNAIFCQQVLNAAGLTFADASIPGNMHMVADGDDVLSQDYASPRGNEMDSDDLYFFGNIPR